MVRSARIGITVIAAALAVASPFIIPREGESLVAYQDSVKVWTICHGETYGVRPGDRLTKAQCDDLSKARIGMFMLEIVPLIHVELAPDTLAAHTSFAYNVGVPGYKKSTALQLTNQGRIAEGCRAMGNWYRAGGKDCRVRSNNCHGLWKRRQDEISLCLKGLQ